MMLNDHSKLPRKMIGKLSKLLKINRKFFLERICNTKDFLMIKYSGYQNKEFILLVNQNVIHV